MDKAELYELLRSTDETLLLELLEINSTELVDMFIDKIEENEDRIRKYLDSN